MGSPPRIGSPTWSPNSIRRMRTCVVGMHRSGTSITARVLGQLGVDLGPEETLLEPDATDNPRGYWEQSAVIDLNDELLERLGGLWTDPPRLRPGWHTAPELDDLRSRAGELLEQTFPDDHWAMKDPRCSLTLPFWRSVEPDLRVVICVRDPRDMAESWARRGAGFEARFALELWMEHTARALIDSEDVPRLIIHHEDFFRDLDAQVNRLAGFAGLPVETVSPETRAAIREFVTERLWRSRAATVGEPLPPEVASLYEALCAVPPDAQAGDDHVSELARTLLARRHRSQNRDLRGYRWPQWRERARRKRLKPFLWWVRNVLFAGRRGAESLGQRHERLRAPGERLYRRIGIMIGALDRRRKEWRVE
jgi:hypothetical protein